MSPNEVSHIEYVAIDNYPAVPWFLVLGYHEAGHYRDGRAALLIKGRMGVSWGDRLGASVGCELFGKKEGRQKEKGKQKSFHH